VNEQLLSLSGALLAATGAKTALASSHVRLFKSTLVPTPETVLADFVSAEADFDGYPSGGIVVTAMNNPILDPAGGYSIGSPEIQFETDAAEATPNLIGGWFQVTSGTVLYGYSTFGSPQPMQTPGQGLPINFRWAFPTG